MFQVMIAQVGIALLSLCVPNAGIPQASSLDNLPSVGVSPPDFVLPDVHTGAGRRLSDFSRVRRPVALFFFCGCAACHAVARVWATYQRGDALPKNAATVIVYSTTDRAEARAHVAAAGLDPKRSAALCDTEDLRVTERLYHAGICPRIVVIDPSGKTVYVNIGSDEKLQESVPSLLAARALAALTTNAP